jgi:arylsulfatase A-like enzyme
MNHALAWPAPAEFRAWYEASKLPLPPSVDGDLTGKPAYLASVRNRTQADVYGYREPQKVREHIRDYYAVVSQLDAMIGRLLAAVDRLALRDNTWVVFLSDNGWLLGEHRMTSKVLAYDDSVRIPLLISGPGVRARVEPRLALNLDLAPTLLDLAGAVPEARIHGRSLRPLIEGGEVPWRGSFVYECLDGYGGTRPMLGAITTEWSLIATWEQASDVGSDLAPFLELYDRSRDRAEMSNVAAEPRHREVLMRLQGDIERHVRLMKRWSGLTPSR